MTTIDPTILWTVIIGLAIGSFGLRFAFIGLMANRTMPAWLMRHLRYTAVAIIPALVAPLVAWPTPTGGVTSLPHLLAAGVTLAVGLLSKNVLAAMAGGGATLFGLLYLFG
ncbi:AzlD domain-containing protein [Parasedimentitalea maritima]|uniref:AzlD domain-containing protein n=2 Tax=Parasedimentitalea TaxID=2738399 RepID=A0A6L6WBQ9_9RHOB|nr:MULTISPECIES: AzlD domain-containing protein [Zongyanglinia]KAE9632640.1 AzlD domain-containing protein [Zongyanglinia marina]MVO15124.1 AzlD domain-containing protein [Zongyanglinia huanghaiensis]TLP69148.1 AzlD domain-containing protein [Zongyanglinia marina]